MDRYKLLINEVSIALKPFSYIRKGNTLFVSKYNNWGMLNFQKSQSSSRELISFTINLGICSNSIRGFNELNIETKPDLEDCHWKKRIGFLMPQKQDYWWRIDQDTSLESISSIVIKIIISLGLPELERYMQDENLQTAWLRGDAPGLTELQRYINLTTLLKAKNDNRILEVVEDLKRFSRGKFFEETAKDHLKKLDML